MIEIVNKLLADLKSRLGSKSTRPSKAEIDKWAPFRIPFSVPMMLSILYFIFCISGYGFLVDLLSRDIAFWLFGPFSVVVFTTLVFMARPRLNNQFILQAYRKLLKENERFTLYEYSKYLKRQINAAINDPSLGGDDEVRQLKQLHAKLGDILRKGSVANEVPVSSTLADEALVAESVIETYEATKIDTLKSLDDRLPEELRSRLDDLEREFGAETTPKELE